jgi:hypothetical protein
MKKCSSFLPITLVLLLAPGTTAAPYGDGFSGGDLNKYVDTSTRTGKVRIEGNALVLDDAQANIKSVPVTAGSAMRLRFEASFEGPVESIEDNPRLDIFLHPGARGPVLPSREIIFLDQDQRPTGQSRRSCMPLRQSHDYIDDFHVPPGAVSMRLQVNSGKDVTLSVRNLTLDPLPAGEGILNLNHDFGLGPFSYSGWRTIAGGGTLIDAGERTIFDSKYGSRGTEFPLAGPGTYALCAKATGNGFNATVHLDVFDAAGTKLMRSTVRSFDQANHFLVPPGAASASLLVYSCLLEEVQVRRVGDENAIGPSPDRTLKVRSDFAGGSVRVIGIDSEKRVIGFTPGGDPHRGWPCWWFFRVDGATPGKTITLRLRGSDSVVGKPGAPMHKPISPNWAMPHRATWSGDGTTWQHTEQGDRQGEWMTYTFTPEATSVYVAWGPPYTPEDATRHIRNFSKETPYAKAVTLCRSRENRQVPMLHIREGDRPQAQRFGVWVQARQHAWESGSSWVAQGFMEWILGNTPEAAWLRQHAEIFVVPVMDIDHTATGDGGKDARPHDHNRDWSEEPIWNEVKAAQQRIQALIADGRMDIFIDLHNPAPGDPTFFYVPDAKLLKEPAVTLRNRFVDLAYDRISRTKPMIPMSNKPKTTGSGYHPLWRQISSNWVAMHGNPQTVSLCLETIWNSPRSTTDGYRSVGAALGETIREFLAEGSGSRQ